jgi:hypothetical protein
MLILFMGPYTVRIWVILPKIRRYMLPQSSLSMCVGWRVSVCIEPNIHKYIYSILF